MTEKKRLTLPGGFTLPISLVTEHYRAYDRFPVDLDAQEAETILQQVLLDRLQAQLTPGGEILDYTFETQAADGVFTVCLHAECLENIAVEAPLSGAREDAERD